MHNVTVGIDLGTTNSLIALWDGHTIRFAQEDGSAIIPSVVGLHGGVPVVGQNATQEAEAVRSIKRFMGKTNDVVALERTPVEISAAILEHLKALAQQQWGCPIDKAVITVPAYFDEPARAATKRAAELAGIEVMRLISEPTAAAIAYGKDHAQEGETYAVYDLGGGTFDISIIHKHHGVLEVLATAGDTTLGGDDFDLQLANLIAEKCGLRVSRQLILEARLIKEQLSRQMSWAGKIGEYDCYIKRSEFVSVCAHLVARTGQLLLRALKDAKVEMHQLNEIILVGGATRMPMIAELLESMSKRKPLDSLDPDKTVVIGAAVQAYNLCTHEGDLLLDVTPLSLKIALADGSTETIIPRNSTIPAIGKRTFTTQANGQTGFILQILQGEAQAADKCRLLGEYQLNGIPNMPAGSARLEVTFRIDADGILVVNAVETTSGVAQEVMLRPSFGLDMETIAQQLQALGS